MKNLLTDEEDGGENWKIISINIVIEKVFQLRLRIEKEKPRLVERDWVRRDLDDEKLGQNKVLYSSSEVKLLMVKLLL